VLNIPYKGFREWQTNDGLLTLTAKVISVDKKEVKIEKEDGKQFTIELSALRKEDQDYVKRQLNSETKASKEEKTKD
jgi:preprotein translocase subunit YajC